MKILIVYMNIYINFKNINLLTFFNEKKLKINKKIAILKEI